LQHSLRVLSRAGSGAMTGAMRIIPMDKYYFQITAVSTKPRFYLAKRGYLAAYLRFLQ